MIRALSASRAAAEPLRGAAREEAGAGIAAASFRACAGLPSQLAYLGDVDETHEENPDQQHSTGPRQRSVRLPSEWPGDSRSWESLLGGEAFGGRASCAGGPLAVAWDPQGVAGLPPGSVWDHRMAKPSGLGWGSTVALGFAASGLQTACHSGTAHPLLPRMRGVHSRPVAAAASAQPAPQPSPEEDESEGFDALEKVSKRQALEAARAAAQREQEIEDLLFAKLDAKRARNETVWHPPPGAAPSLLGRVKEVARGVVGATQWLLKALVRVPWAVSAFLAKGPTHWRNATSEAWKHAKEEMHHYWVGSKLLYTEVGVASELLWKVLQGNELSRREKAQLTRTSADLFRLVPMLVFVLIPFMEFLLPVALKLFPNMLPSTFEDKLKKEEQLRKRLALKLDVARFLQDTVAEMAKEIKQKKTGTNAATAAELYDFMGKVRAGEPVTNTDITKFSQLFNDELTLDNLERVQLQSMLTFVGLPPYGTDGFLKSRLRHHLAAIKGDDREIVAEGVDSLTDTEMREACRARGMRAHFGEHARAIMTRNLEEWLELSMTRSMPTSLLLLSRAFTVTTRTSKLIEEQIRETLGSLPDEVLEDVSIQACLPEETSKAAELEKKLALVKREKERIEEERIEAKMEEEARQAALEQKAAVPPEGELSVGMTDPKLGPEEQHEMAVATARAVVKEASAGLVRQSNEEKEAWLAEKREKRMQEIISALALLASYSGVSDERHEFMKLVHEQIKAMDEHVKDRGSNTLLFTAGELKSSTPLPEDEVLTDVSDKVTGILKRVEKELDAADQQIKSTMKILDQDGDGMISFSEMSKALGFLQRQMGEDELRALLERLDCSAEGRIEVDALMRLAQRDVTEHEQIRNKICHDLENPKLSSFTASHTANAGAGKTDAP